MPYLTLTTKPQEWATAGSSDTAEFERLSIDQSAVRSAERSIIFVSHPHTHQLGGVQRQSNRLFDILSADYHITRASRMAGVSPIASAWWQWRHGEQLERDCLVYCDDAVSGILGTRMFSGQRRNIVATVHGLDVIAPVSFYQRLVRRALGRLSHVVCVSRATAQVVAERGVDPERISVIPNAAEPVAETIERSPAVYDELQRALGSDLRGKTVLLSVGRPIKRKGFDLFIKSVFPSLPDDFVYIVAGPPINPPAWVSVPSRFLSAERRRRVLVAMGYHNVHEQLISLSRHPRVFYLNGVSERMRNLLYAAADQFIMPNRTIRGDMEGFGIVALEAAVRGIPIVATGIEGIVDAVIDGQNGTVVPEGDTSGMIAAIKKLAERTDQERRQIGLRAQAFTQEQFSIERVGRMYLQLFSSLATQHA